jgi:hypothetical protein
MLGIILTAALCAATCGDRAGAPQRAESPAEILPRPVRTALDEKFPGWRLSPVVSRATEVVRRRSPRAQPNLISGDFDGNGQTDYAALIEYAAPRKGAPEYVTGAVVAFLAEQGSYKPVIVREVHEGRFRYVVESD